VEASARTGPTAELRPRLAELVAALSLATDLGLGQAMDHGLRGCLIATRLAERVGLEEPAVDAVYWVSLLAMVGCTADSFEVRLIFGDDLLLRDGMFSADPSQLGLTRYFLSRAGSDGGPLRRVREGARLLATGMRSVAEALTTHCQITGLLANRLGFGPAVRDPLQHAFARWDGKGLPPGVAGNAIALPARIMTVANYVEVAHRLHGIRHGIELAQRHAGLTMDPDLVGVLEDGADEILGDLDDNPWEAVIAAEPGPRARLGAAQVDAVLEALGDFSDLKSPWFTGHSRRVAELAEAAARRTGLPEDDVVSLRRAALVHGLGRAGVPNTIWDKHGPLTRSERERIQLYPYYTDRILRRGSLAPLADLASASHERLDGSGYPRGLHAAAIAAPARLLAAANLYDTLTSARPHRDPFTPHAAATQLRHAARAEKLDGDTVEAVLTAAGHRAPPRASAPAALTPREVEVLKLIATGCTTAQIAQRLTIAHKTADHHIQHIYAKIGTSNRSAATLFAMQHGLV
jgi:HD-GYP domain-containing protein (c-di-GMP phosphodiesterase class II)